MAHPQTATAPSDSERLVDQLANRIGGLGVELADVAGNLQEVAGRVAGQSDRFGHLQKTAETMVSANHGIASASQTVQTASTAAASEITQSRAAVETAVQHISELVEAVGRIEGRLASVGAALAEVAKYPDRSRQSRGKPICWRSMRRSRRPAPAKPAGALRSSPAK